MNHILIYLKPTLFARKVVSAFIAVAFAVSVIGPGEHRAHAYELLGGEWGSISNMQVCVSTSYGNDYYRWLDSLYWWYNTSTDFAYTTTCSSNVVSMLDADYSGVSWDGLATLSPSLSSVPYDYGWAYLNYHYIQNYNAYKANSVSVHELGHILGLAHESGCVSMRDNTYDRYDVCNVIAPTQDDVNGVNYIY